MVNHVSVVLDDAERKGKLSLRTEDFHAALPDLSPAALRQSLMRQQQKGRVVGLSRGSGHWLIVPLKDAAMGAPPLEVWLDSYLRKTLEVPYYVSLLSAAENYGASPYAVMVTQVMVPKQRRALTIGRHQLVFHQRADVERMPVRWHETADGRYRQSTPELTALELVQRHVVAGGLARVREVLRALMPACSADGFAVALDAMNDIRTAQRLGALLRLDGPTDATVPIATWLSGKVLGTVALDPSADRETAQLDSTFKVWMPSGFMESNS